MEVWKPVKGYEKHLSVSNMGRVKSFMRNPEGNILKAQPDKKGYLRLRCTVEGKKLCFKVHRLVAEHFIDNPEGKPQVNHKDTNKRNNAASNLEWATNAENARHAIEHGRWDALFEGAKRCNDAKKTPIIATNIHTGERRYFESMGEAEREIGTKHINQVMKGLRGQAKGYTFRYADGGDANVAGL